MLFFQNFRGHHVVWVCEAQIPRGAHRIQEGLNAPPPNETMIALVVKFLTLNTLINAHPCVVMCIN